MRIEDANGNLCPAADNLVRFDVEGAGRREAVDNGDPATLEPFQADQRHAFGGLALLIVRSAKGRIGPDRDHGALGRPASGTATLTALREP